MIKFEMSSHGFKKIKIKHFLINNNYLTDINIAHLFYEIYLYF